MGNLSWSMRRAGNSTWICSTGGDDRGGDGDDDGDEDKDEIGRMEWCGNSKMDYDDILLMTERQVDINSVTRRLYVEALRWLLIASYERVGIDDAKAMIILGLLSTLNWASSLAISLVSPAVQRRFFICPSRIAISFDCCLCVSTGCALRLCWDKPRLPLKLMLHNIQRPGSSMYMCCFCVWKAACGYCRHARVISLANDYTSDQ